MIYHDTRRPLWHFPRGATRFFGTVLSFAALGNLIANPGSALAVSIFAASVVIKLIPELRFLRFASSGKGTWSPDVHSARLQLGPLSVILRSRFLLAAVSIAIAFIHPWLVLPFLLVAELLERQLFFQSVQAPKMPGTFGPKRGH
jgi:hypothetical protein